jgi:hypothetical protein
MQRLAFWELHCTADLPLAAERALAWYYLDCSAIHSQFNIVPHLSVAGPGMSPNLASIKLSDPILLAPTPEAYLSQSPASSSATSPGAEPSLETLSPGPCLCMPKEEELRWTG